jgi:glycosyltransferase involved in cell wall biosynthesis
MARLRKFFEFAACGKPIIGKPTCELQYSFNKELKSFMGITHDQQELSTYLEYLYQNPDVIKKMGKNARIFIEEGRFSWEEIAQDFCNIIDKYE